MFPWSGEPSMVPAVDGWIRRSERVWDSAHVCLQRAVRTQEIQANRRHHPHPPYQPGQRVWLYTQDRNLRLPSRKPSPRNVLTPTSRARRFCNVMPVEGTLSRVLTVCRSLCFTCYFLFVRPLSMAWLTGHPEVLPVYLPY